MKKLFVLLTSTLLFACSSGPSLDQLATQMPKDNRSVMLQVPEAGNPVSNGMLVATIRTAGGTSGKRLVSLLATDNLHIGIAGNSQSVNKAVAMYGLNNAEKVGNDVSLYLVGDSQSDKADLEKAAKAKNVEMRYKYIRCGVTLMLNLDNKKFVAVENTSNGEVSSQTEFHYHQQGKMIWAEYGGGEILKGFLIGKWINDTQIEFTYQHLNQSLENRLGRCCTTFSLEESKLIGHEKWQWLDTLEQGNSLIREI